MRVVPKGDDALVDQPAQRAKKMGVNTEPLGDLQRAWVKGKAYTTDEKRVLATLLLTADGVTMKVNGPARKERYKSATLRRIAGGWGGDKDRSMSRAAWFRALRVLQHGAGVVTRLNIPHEANPKLVDYTQYNLDKAALTTASLLDARPESWAAWSPAPRPDPEAELRAAATTKALEKEIAQAIEALGLPGNNPVAAKLVRAAKLLDKRGLHLTLAEARLQRRTANHVRKLREFRAALAALQANPPPASTKKRAARDAGVVSDRDQGGVEDGAGVQGGVVSDRDQGGSGSRSPGSSGRRRAQAQGTGVVSHGDHPHPKRPHRPASPAARAARAKQDAEILALLREYAPLAPLATEEAAAAIGDSATRAASKAAGDATGATLMDPALIRRALERFAFKVHKGTWKPDLAAARAFVKRQWPVEHSPVRLNLAQLVADADEPTAEDLAAMRRARADGDLGAVRALAPAPAPPRLPSTQQQGGGWWPKNAPDAPPPWHPAAKRTSSLQPMGNWRPTPERVEARLFGGGSAEEAEPEIDWTMVANAAPIPDHDPRALLIAQAVQSLHASREGGAFFDGTFSSVQLVDLSEDGVLTLGVSDVLAAEITASKGPLEALLRGIGEATRTSRPIRVLWTKLDAVVKPIVSAADRARRHQ